MPHCVKPRSSQEPQAPFVGMGGICNIRVLSVEEAGGLGSSQRF